jgi:hypothetical protein
MDVIRDFWRHTFGVTRFALVGAAVSLLVNAASYVGLSMTATFAWLVVLLHLSVMGLGFVLFIRYGVHHWLAVRVREEPETSSPIPDRLILSTILSGIYCLALFAWVVAIGDGAKSVEAEGSPLDLRAFSSAWTFAFLVIGLDAHRIERRIRAYRAMLRVAV